MTMSTPVAATALTVVAMVLLASSASAQANYAMPGCAYAVTLNTQPSYDCQTLCKITNLTPSGLHSLNPSLDCAVGALSGDRLCLKAPAVILTNPVAGNKAAAIPDVVVPPASVAPVIPTGDVACNTTVTIAMADTCPSLSFRYVLPQLYLEALNPGIDCDHLVLGGAVCVAGRVGHAFVGGKAAHLALPKSAAAAVKAAASAPSSGLTQEQADALALHNAERALVADASSTPLTLVATVPPPPLTWDAKLQASAQGAATTLATKQCALTNGYTGYPGVGENTYALTSSNTIDLDGLPLTRAVDAWIGAVNERMAYAPGGMSHWTQIVWSGTSSVGCGKAMGSSADGFACYVFVCHYSPPGNIDGQNPFPFMNLTASP
ncbi:hypothetical protein HK101_001155 [Irineochytrium annulatum]|nr:hypothetical protein HK101_001155 [Irineochytrium annulatum]